MSSYELTYAAKACALEKSALITLLAFNLVCSLITENSARTRSLFQPNILSNPKRPHNGCLGRLPLWYSVYTCVTTSLSLSFILSLPAHRCQIRISPRLLLFKTSPYLILNVLFPIIILFYLNFKLFCYMK